MGVQTAMDEVLHAPTIVEALRAPNSDKTLSRIRNDIRALCKQFPVPAAAITE